MSKQEELNQEPKDGVIKYKCQMFQDEPMDYNTYLKQLDEYRQKLFDIKLIGQYPECIGYGNISYIPENSPYSQKSQEFSDQGCQQFIITGSATGKVDKLNATHYCLVENFDLQKNCLTCRGPIKASSESMTHGNLYKMDKNTKVVIHVHNNKMWKRLLHKIPTTDKNAQYGTPEIAKEVERLFLETNVKDQKIFVLEGHEDGIFSFGETFQEAYDIIYSYYQRIIINDEEI